MRCSLALLFLLVSMSILSLPAMAQDWTVIPLGTSEDILDVENTGFAEKSIVGSGGFFAQSSAGRTVWTQIDVGTSADLLSVHQPSSNQLWTGGGGGAVRRFVGGIWVARDVPGGGEDCSVQRASLCPGASCRDAAITKLHLVFLNPPLDITAALQRD